MKTCIFRSCLGVIVTLLFLTLATSVMAQDEYFIYANFDSANTGGLFQPGQACGGYAINDTSGILYVARAGGQWCDVYIVSIPTGRDPDTHPANLENQGEMAPRTLALVDSIKISDDIGTVAPAANDFQVTSQYVYFGPAQSGIHQWDKNPDGTPGTYNGKVVTATFVNNQTLAYDEATNTWYAGNYNRDIYSFGPDDDEWQPAFTYTGFEDGRHHDGLEYVGGYLWVSDMTANFVGKWENIEGTWTELAVFSYYDDSDMDVEGMGYGPLGHFWATGSYEMYELGGGGLQVEEIPTLTEWGLIIFGVVLLGFISWVFLRRRRAVVSLR